MISLDKDGFGLIVFESLGHGGLRRASTFMLPLDHDLSTLLISITLLSGISSLAALLRTLYLNVRLLLDRRLNWLLRGAGLLLWLLWRLNLNRRLRLAPQLRLSHSLDLFSLPLRRSLGVLLLEPSGDEFEVLDASLVIRHEEVHLGHLGAQVVRLPDRPVDLQYAVELLVHHSLPPVEGHVALGTARHHVHGLLVGYLKAQTGLAEEVEAGQLDWLLVHLQTDRAFHLVAELLVEFTVQRVVVLLLQAQRRRGLQSGSR